MTHLVVTLPLKIVSTANAREHWSIRARRARNHRFEGCLALGPNKVKLPCVVTLTRIAPRELDDDNLAISFKSVRDGVADHLGIDDRDKRVTWRYQQERGAPKHYGCRIEVTGVSEQPARSAADAPQETEI